ncbi:MAG TPA: EamA-like transporter family protein [Clostridiales bacterium]|nr:EamA-like transporter family protein [Clostridiales bacterium]
MYNSLSIFIGALIAAMVVLNGELSSIAGSYPATVIIHIVGLLLSLVLLIIKRGKRKSPAKIPFPFYLGGVVGVGTTLFTNLAFGNISISAILALSLLGESVTALFIDQYGLFGSVIRRINRRKIVGLLWIIAGISVMIIF